MLKVRISDVKAIINATVIVHEKIYAEGELKAMAKSVLECELSDYGFPIVVDKDSIVISKVEIF